MVPEARPLDVVKIGGSLEQAAALPALLDALAACPGRIVAVAGGGSFADAVRGAQARWGFDDATAHRMALLAMEQFGLSLAALHPALTPAATRAEIDAALARGEVAVWMPSAMALAEPAVEPTWAMSADSLAAFLAARLAARRLLLLKSVACAAGEQSVARLAARGVVDEALGRWIPGRGFSTWLLDGRRAEPLQAWLQGRDAPATRVVEG